MLVNNGKYRRTLIVIRKFYDGEESFTGGFPVLENILNGFAEYPSLSPEEFQLLPDPDYQLRLAAFYTYLGIKYPFFNPSENIPDIGDGDINSNGDDTDYCPVDYPSSNMVYLSLEVEKRVDGDDRYATVKATLRNRLGNPVTLGFVFYGSFVLKEFEGAPQTEWDNIEGSLETFEIGPAESETIIIPEFKYKGSGILMSVQAVLNPPDEADSIYIYPTSKVCIMSSEPAFLVNYISTLQHAYQDMISNAIAQEKVNYAEGVRLLGKKDYIFTFEPDQPKRPVFMYPKSWGKLSEILLVQAQNMNIINDGAFLFDNNGEPFEYDLTVDDEVVRYYVYASKAMIIYPYRAEYVFKF